MTHPLTDALAESIASTELKSPFGIGELVFTYNDMRAAYDMGAADRLDKVIEQWEELMDSDKTDIQMVRAFDKQLKAMRPQEES